MQYIGFLVNGNEYTVPITKIQEIINQPKITKLPLASDCLMGITNLRGRVIPIISLKRAMKLANDETKGQNTKIIVISSGKITFGVEVDEIVGVISIEEEMIETPENFMSFQADQVEGVARLNDRIVILLDTNKLAPVTDIELLKDDVIDVIENKEGNFVVTKTIQTIGGEMLSKEIVDAKTYFEQKAIPSGDSRSELYTRLMDFMEAVASQDYEKADNVIQELAQAAPSKSADGKDVLFKEVGRVTRKLHDSVKNFKEALDPRLKDITSKEVPSAIDKLQFVIESTEEAANKTMGIVEKHIMVMDELSTHIKSLKGPKASVEYLKQYKNGLEDDLTEILTTQGFQDLTGQTLKKVITLVGEVESELVGLITAFGVKSDSKAQAEVIEETVSQEGVDDLLKEFGF